MTTQNDGTYTLKVNGDEMQMSFRFVVAHDILELAEKHSAIAGAPDEYILKSILVDDREYGRNEQVDLEKDNVFISLPNTPTQVA